MLLKFQKKKFKFCSKRKQKFSFGLLGLVTKEAGLISKNEIETVKLFLKKSFKKKSLVTFRIFAAISKTKKPIESRMGKGKGVISFWVAKVKKGSLILEVNGSNFSEIKIFLKVAKHFFSLKTKFISLNLKA